MNRLKSNPFVSVDAAVVIVVVDVVVPSVMATKEGTNLLIMAPFAFASEAAAADLSLRQASLSR